MPTIIVTNRGIPGLTSDDLCNERHSTVRSISSLVVELVNKHQVVMQLTAAGNKIQATRLGHFYAIQYNAHKANEQ